MPSLTFSRNWRRPSTWHLRTRLVLVAMALLVAICGATGIVSYASMDSFLTEQLDGNLKMASANAGRAPSSSPNGSPDPLNARGSGAGTMFARIQNGKVSSAGFVAWGAGQTDLSPQDNAALLSLPMDGKPVTRTLADGDYRLLALQMRDGGVLVTGLPLAARESTLNSLVWTMTAGSLAGILLIGLVGTAIIRRNLLPLEQLSDVATQVSRLPLDAGEVALAVRVPPSSAHPGTEVGRVGHALNLMLDNVFRALESRQRSETKVRQFVADASHELRTPLTAIRGYTELMRMTENLTPDGTKSLARVQSQSERMTALVEDLLMLARIDEGQQLRLADVDLTQLLVETVSDERVMAPDRHWKLELPGGAVAVRGDASGLRQVLTNLLSNARKHTPPGTTVVAGLAKSEEGNVVISVTDDGPGIDPEFVDNVFARFTRGDASRASTHAGGNNREDEGSSGLGLSIVHSIMAAHGGRVEVASRPGRTCFLITFHPQGTTPSS
ncbi:HAMP domain-containing sensor histidine kinase [Arthrobacter sp.]|uniref:sensor histidine kinase n=1 Tax=Arthrobacter sp. TaxID=1667 RepID=UPI002812197A|nr:HAMP domain-containing sensor histidine kinase [Arthrobacter sp.]